MHTLIHWIKAYISLVGKVSSYVIPAIVSVFIYSIIGALLTPDYRLYLAVLITILLVFLYVELNKIFQEYSILTDTIVDILLKDIERHSEKLSERAARVYPDTPTISLKNYLNAITSIRTNGFIEFSNCALSGLDTTKKGELMLYTVSPGMHQYFMILCTNKDHLQHGYLRIYPPEDMDVDSRDFTETWFNHIFVILGNLSNSVSEKLEEFYDGSGSELSSSYYLIRKYKIQKRRNGRVSFRILF